MKNSAMVYLIAVIMLAVGGLSLQASASVKSSDATNKRVENRQVLTPTIKDSSIEVAIKRIYIGSCGGCISEPPPVPGG